MLSHISYNEKRGKSELHI